jgi:hypothetical protein
LTNLLFSIIMLAQTWSLLVLLTASKASRSLSAYQKPVFHQEISGSSEFSVVTFVYFAFLALFGCFLDPFGHLQVLFSPQLLLYQISIHQLSLFGVLFPLILLFFSLFGRFFSLFGCLFDTLGHLQVLLSLQSTFYQIPIHLPPLFDPLFPISSLYLPFWALFFPFLGAFLTLLGTSMCSFYSTYYSIKFLFISHHSLALFSFSFYFFPFVGC